MQETHVQTVVPACFEQCYLHVKEQLAAVCQVYCRKVSDSKRKANSCINEVLDNQERAGHYNQWIRALLIPREKFKTDQLRREIRQGLYWSIDYAPELLVAPTQELSCLQLTKGTLK